jgi:cytochrome oxidase Cu insertion factor (SCO1/SenC/PrrC family)
MPRALRTLAVGLLATTAVLLGLVWAGRYWPDSAIGRVTGARIEQTGSDAASLADISIGGPFNLVDPSGRAVTQASYPGRWKLIYFGYTSCPDICPTTLQSMAGALVALGAQADRLVPLFITIDPARDTPDVLARYTRLFDPRIVALTGTPAQLAAAEQSFRVYAARVDQPGTGSYLMDHTSFVYLIDPQGRLQALFDHDVTSAVMAARRPPPPER